MILAKDTVMVLLVVKSMLLDRLRCWWIKMSGYSGDIEDVLEQSEKLRMTGTRLVLMVLSEKLEVLDIELSSDCSWILIFVSLIFLVCCRCLIV